MRKILLLIAAALMLTMPSWATGGSSSSSSSSSTDHGNGWLGLYTQTVDKDLKEAFKLDSDHGVVINRVMPNSPADKAGLKPGDILLSLEGTNLTTSEQLAELVGDHNSGDRVKLEVLHNGKPETIFVELGERQNNSSRAFMDQLSQLPSPRVFSKSYRFSQTDVADTYIGVNLESINSQLGEYFGVSEGKGVLVTEVLEDSPAAKAGLKVGDVIVAMNGKDISDPSDIQDAVREAKKGDKLDISFLRNKSKMDLAVEVAARPDNMYSTPGTQIPGLDNYFRMNLPKMKGLAPGTFDYNSPDIGSMQESIKELQDQIKELQEQLKEMQNAPKK
jgi:S1-C subfamily serine protease